MALTDIKWAVWANCPKDLSGAFRLQTGASFLEMALPFSRKAAPVFA